MNDSETGAATPRSPGWLRIILIGRNPKRTLSRAVVLAVVCYVFFKYVVFESIVLPVRVEGNSMFPTYHDKTRNFVNRLAYRRSEPQRGDVVGIRMAGPRVMLLKRIVGMPGETVSFADGHLFINGKQFDEPYLKNPMPAPDLEPETLEADEFYVIGD